MTYSAATVTCLAPTTRVKTWNNLDGFGLALHRIYDQKPDPEQPGVKNMYFYCADGFNEQIQFYAGNLRNGIAVAMAVVYLLISKSLPSNASTCHNMSQRVSDLGEFGRMS
jgi:hypothetical protein